VLTHYVRELAAMDASAFEALVSDRAWGFWNVPELDATREGIHLGVQAFCPGDDPAQDLQFVVEVVSSSPVHRVYADGFAVRRDHRIEPLTDEEWAFWNI
jgi:hypothetical protein